MSGGTFRCKSKQIVLFFLALLFVCGCSSPSEQVQEEFAVAAETRKPLDCKQRYQDAAHMDSLLLNALETSDTLAARAIHTFTHFAIYCANDSLSPVYLIKTAQVARAVGRPDQARAALEECIRKYRDFRDRPAAIFLLGQLFEDDSYMSDRDAAAANYRQVIDEYPGSVWAENARAALQLLGKSDAEIIEMFKRKP